MAWFNPNDPNAGAASLLTDEQIKERRRLAAAMGANASKPRPMTHWAQALAQGLEGAMAGYEAGQVEKADKASSETLAKMLEGGFTGGAAPAAPIGAPAPNSAANDTGPAGTAAIAGAGPLNISPEIKDGIVQTASALGIDPVDLATAISYETAGTFEPTKRGPSTQWGQHRGLIQFGEPQAKEHGVDWANPVGSQLGPNGAIASYLKQRGVQPGMGLLDIYSAINAGGVGLYDRSDAKNGGAPGTVRDKVEKQMQGHRAKAQALFAQNADMPAPGAAPVEMPGAGQGFAVPPGAVQPIEGDDPATLRADAQAYAQSNPEAARQLLARADAAEASQPPAMPAPAQAAAPGPLPLPDGNAPLRPLDPVFTSEGASQPWMGTAIQPPAQGQVGQPGPIRAGAPMPPPRPADLAVSQADMPAPGAVPAVGQMPPPAQPAMPDLTNMESGGAREFAVAEGERRLGQPSGAPIGLPQRLAAFLGGSEPISTAQAGPTPQRLGAALGGQPGMPEAQVASGSNGQGAALDPRARLGLALIRAGRRAEGTALVMEAQKPPQYGFTTTPDGTVLRQNPRTGQVEPAYKVDPKKNMQIVDIGTDPQTGASIKGTFDPQTGVATPLRQQPPTGAAQPSTIPPVPAGVDPKVWREAQSKRAAEEGMPAGFDDTAKVRNEIKQLPSYKNVAQAAPIYRSMMEAAGRDTRAADVNLIYGIAKIMDPTSVVRESEMTVAQAIATLPQQLRQTIESQITSSGRLSPEVRAGIMAEAHGRMQSYAGLYQQDADFYRGIATKNRMDPGQVVQDFGKFDPYAPPQPASPVPGAPAPAGPAPVVTPPAGAPAAALKPAAPPSGIDPKVWQHMTPEERALWN